METLTLLRPLVAVSWLVSMGVRALEDLAALRGRLAGGGISPFWVAQEVRRCTPSPRPWLPSPPPTSSGAGWRCRPGRCWCSTSGPPTTTRTPTPSTPTPHPHAFDPDRFASADPTPYDLVPQGGGEVSTGHRCPEEDLTLAVLATLLRALAVSRVRVGSGTGVRLDRMPPDPSCLVRVDRARTLVR